MTPPILGEQIRILHVVRPAAGGIRQHVLELLRRTDPMRFTVSVAGPRDFLHGLPADLPVTERLLLDIAPGLSPARDLLAAARLAQYTGHRQGLITHAHGLRAAFVAALARRLSPSPLVFTAHNLVSGGRLTRLGVRFAGGQADRVVAISGAVAQGLTAAGVLPDKITIIPNGVDLEHFIPRPPITGETHQPPITGEQEAPQSPGLREAGRAFTVGCVARLSREKGMDVLLRAAALLPEVRFLIAGVGPERDALNASAPPNVRWLGRVADTREVYGASDVIAIPSRQEGQGIVALEAMASGVSVVASRVGGLAEMLTDGETALLVPPDAPDALADALARLCRDPALRGQLAVYGRALVRDHYDVRRMMEAVQDAYAAMAAGRIARSVAPLPL